MSMIKKLFIILSALVMTSCTNTLSRSDKGLIDDENMNIISRINELAVDNFIAKKLIVKEEEAEEIANPKYKSDNKEEIIKNLEPYIEDDPKVKWVYDNFYTLTNIEAYLTGNDMDTVEFVYNMHHGPNNYQDKPGQSVDLGRKTPYYIQWDNRWAYNNLGYRNIGISGCGPTSMAMVLSRLKNDPTITPTQIAEDAKPYMVEDGISWNFFTDKASVYGYTIEEVHNDKEAMKEALRKGPLLVSVNRGYFTLYGHIVVIDSYENGKFLINDPNSIKNSKRAWTYEELSNQIAKIWSIY